MEFLKKLRTVGKQLRIILGNPFLKLKNAISIQQWYSDCVWSNSNSQIEILLNGSVGGHNLLMLIIVAVDSLEGKFAKTYILFDDIWIGE